MNESPQIVTIGGLGEADTKNQSRTIRIVTTNLIGLQVFLLLAGWLYRATLYWKIPVASGEPYGLGDVIELLINFVLLGSSALTLVVALVFAVVRRLRHWRAIGALACAGILAVPLFLTIHAHLPH
jgi:hypothetical protein